MRRSREPERGQAGAEYVALLAVLVVALGAAATAGAAPELPRLVAGRLRLALCVVGADVCDAARARAEGLSPCVLASRGRERGAGITVAFVRGATGRDYVVQRLSGGGYRISRADHLDVDATAGVGASLGPHARATGSGAAGVELRTGAEWALRDDRELRAFFAARHEYADAAPDPVTGGRARAFRPGRRRRSALDPAILRRLEPTSTYVAGGLHGSLDAALALGGDHGSTGLPAAGLDGRGVLGRRLDRDGTTTLFVDTRLDGSAALADDLPGFAGTGRIVAEWQRSRPPALTLRATTTTRAGRVTETVSRVVLHDPADRELAARAVLGRHRGLAATALRNLIRERGTVERATYAETTTDDGSFDVSGRAGFALGLDVTARTVRRRLVDAEAVIGGSQARRADCLDADVFEGR